MNKVINMRPYLLYIVLIFSMTYSQAQNNIQELTIRTDGYYFCHEIKRNIHTYDVMLMTKNGIFLGALMANVPTFDEFDIEYLDTLVYTLPDRSYGVDLSMWGYYKINDEKIFLRKYWNYDTTCFDEYYAVISDTALFVYSSRIVCVNSNQKKKRGFFPENMTYMFRKLDNVPDLKPPVDQLPSTFYLSEKRVTRRKYW